MYHLQCSYYQDYVTGGLVLLILTDPNHKYIHARYEKEEIWLSINRT